MELSEAQQVALALLPKFTATVSVTCSASIVLIILRDPQRRSKVFHRIILGLSITDALTSAWWALSTWPVPRESGILWAVGSTMSCTFQGFFLQVGIANPLYNLSVSVYFLLTIHWRWVEEKTRKIEYLFHLGPLGWGISTAIIGLPLKIFNSANLWCWIANYPGRTENADVFRWGIFYAPLWLAAILVGVNLFIITVHFQKVTRFSEGHFRRSIHIEDDIPQQACQPIPEGDEDEDEDENYPSSLEEEPAESASAAETMRKISVAGFASRRRRLAWECLRYTTVFYVTWFPITLWRILQAMGKEIPFPLMLLSAMLTPLQGLPNIIVYLYPLILKRRKKRRTRKQTSVNQPDKSQRSNSEHQDSTAQIQESPNQSEPDQNGETDIGMNA